ncbi:DUF6042 family protein [Streptomyces cynarae]|uniref:DUF6042 family protein n=1 Tax=Streptomyces cynarae TaxID=2981134 RepID=A0ABY6EBG8_9ACTN|nr:DUF6042 family protein [Streptomyces cynarae]UXY24040.1 DUF6042 family protein [Streptomyces cynarae]
MRTEPLTDWSQDHREQHFHSVIGGGWLRMPPPMLGLLLAALTGRGKPLTREELRPFVRSSVNSSGDWHASCWGDGDERDRADLTELRAAQAATSTRYAAHYGLPPLSTLNDMLTLMIAAGLVHEIPDADGQTRLYPAFPLPGPHEVFPLDDKELSAQQVLRRHLAYGGDSSRIIALFDPTGLRHQEITTSLDRLAHVIDEHSHDARQAVLLLLEGPDFTATTDISEIPPHKVFQLRCDWDTFHTHRIRRGRQGRIAATVPTDGNDST